MVVAITDSLILVGLVLALAGRGRTRTVIFAFGLVLVADMWHVSPEARSFVAIRQSFNSLEAAGLTFAMAMLCRKRKVPRALAWLGLVSYSVYLLHPALLEIYPSVPWTEGENFVPMELLMVAVFVLVLLICCALTYRFIEAPMQRKGRQVARRLNARFGADVPPSGLEAPLRVPAEARSPSSAPVRVLGPSVERSPGRLRPLPVSSQADATPLSASRSIAAQVRVLPGQRLKGRLFEDCANT